MTVLLTGGLGYIGSHTCVELLSKGADVVIVDNLCNSYPEVVERIETITGKRPVFYELDVCDEPGLSAVFDRHSIDCVIHFAGLKAVGESVVQPHRYYANNLCSTLTLTRVMDRHGVKRIIFSSSATVYSADNQMPLTEASKTGSCTNPYGWTKFMGEQILQDLTVADPLWSVVLLRYFNPIGAHPSGLMGEDPQGIPNNLMPYVSQVAVGRRPQLQVFGNDYPTPDGTGIRDYIHVVDLAKGHVAAMDWVCSHTGAEVFNLGTGKGHSVLELVDAFCAVSGANVPYVIAPRRAGDLAVCYADPAKSRELLGWTAQYDLRDMCRDSWNWQKNNPLGYKKEEQS